MPCLIKKNALGLSDRHVMRQFFKTLRNFLKMEALENFNLRNSKKIIKAPAESAESAVEVASPLGEFPPQELHPNNWSFFKIHIKLALFLTKIESKHHQDLAKKNEVSHQTSSNSNHIRSFARPRLASFASS